VRVVQRVHALDRDDTGPDWVRRQMHVELH
jgi:hypothetical protein